MAPKRISKSTISAPTPTTVTATAYKFQLPALNIPKSSLAEGTPIPLPAFEHSPPISPPQTPLSTDSPNPLRSHPTSSHSLTRKFSADAAMSLNGSRVSPPRLNGTPTAYRQPATTPSQTKRSYTPTPASPTAPPSKRPHIRKLLSLKSLASLNRSSAELSHTQQHEKTGYSVEIRSQSPTPSTSTSTSTLSKLKRRSSGVFWRRNSGFAFGLGHVNEENGDVTMGGMDDVHRKATPPPTLPEFDTLGGGLETATLPARSSPTIRRQPSGWFGGDKMFDGIGRR